jgi:hypothetical protein
MPDLERQLEDLGRSLAFPPTPDLASSVRRRLAGEERRRFRLPARRPLAIAAAALAAGIAVAFAVPPARTAILRVFGVGGVRIERVDRLPAVSVARRLRLGRQMSLAEARARARFRVRVPRAGGFDDPDAVYFSDAVPGGLVSFLYGSETRPLALLTEFETEPGFPHIDKSAPPGTRLESVSVGGDRGYWLEGEPHLFAFRNRAGATQFGRLRLATNTLVWQHDGLTLRLEGKLTKSEALDIAESTR